MQRLATLFFASVLGLTGAASASASQAPIDWEKQDLTSIRGQVLPAETFQGRAVLVVNTASKCAFTPQYKGLEALWDDYSGLGLVVLGIPSNDFGRQEPGSNEDIAEFCSATYGVSFPMLSKANVVGQNAHPIFAWARDAGGTIAVPAWNFHKILIGRDGRFVAGYPSYKNPTAADVRRAIESALAKPAF